MDVSETDADVASALLFELGAQGVEERDKTTLTKSQGDKVTLVASFESAEEADAALREIDPGWSPRRDELVGDAWRDAWKEHFRPFEICKGILVAPPWDIPPSGASLVLEPGRAFGTGLHESTRLVSDLLASLAPLSGEILDVGTGSGVLSLVALKLGASRARATDIDPDAIDVTRENATRNQLTDRIEADTTPIDGIAGTYPTVVANIEARVLIPMAPLLMDRVAPGGVLILSGILVPQKDDVVRAFSSFALEAAPVMGEWVALALRRTA